MPPDGQALIDVLIPAYNSEATIESAVRSIQDQTVTAIRILVVDDGSTDRTSEIVAAIAAADPRVEHIRKPGNSGIVDTLNIGLARCRAAYVARHDADDIAYPNRFEVQLALLEPDPDLIAVGAVARHIDERGNQILQHGGFSRPPPPELADPHRFPSREPYLMHPFLMARRDALVAVGGYRYVVHAEDTDLYWRLQERGRLHNPPDLLGDYRFHTGSITSGSVHNGRVGALNSQLAAISALRRRAGKPDLDFPPERLALYRAARGVADLLRIVQPDLTPEERAYLEPAVAAKLLELASYRPYLLEAADCRFIRATLLAHWHRFGPEDAAELQEKLVTVGTRMFYHRRLREIAALLPRAALARTVQRVAGITLQTRLERLRRARARARTPEDARGSAA